MSPAAAAASAVQSGAARTARAASGLGGAMSGCRASARMRHLAAAPPGQKQGIDRGDHRLGADPAHAGMVAAGTALTAVHGAGAAVQIAPLDHAVLAGREEAELGTVAPKMTTAGVPAATARWVSPESLPTATSAVRSAAARSRSSPRTLASSRSPAGHGSSSSGPSTRNT